MEFLNTEKISECFRLDVRHPARLEGKLKKLLHKEAGYVIEVPTSFKLKSSLPHPDARNFSALGTFSSEGQPNVCLTVEVSRIQQEVNPADWLTIELQHRGHQFLGNRRTYTKNGWDIDALTTCLSQNLRRVARHLVRKDGDLIYWISAHAPEAEFQEMADEFIHCLRTFSVERLPQLDVANLETFEFNDVVPLNLQFPKSWELTRESVSREEFTLQIRNWVSDIVLGCVTVIGSKNLNPKLLASRFTKDCESRKLPVDSFDFQETAFQGVGYSHANAKAQSPDGRVFDVGALLFSNAYGSYLIGTATPQLEDAPEWWAINRRCFELVRDSLVASHERLSK